MKFTISQIIGELNSPWLMKWANKIGLEWIKLDEYQSKSKDKWISLHNEIQNKIKRDWFYKDYNLIAIEHNLNWENFYWRCDIILEKDWVKCIFDFKSNDEIYLNHKLQLIWYKILYWECKIWIITLSNNKEYFIDESEEENLILLFKSLYNVKKLRTLIWNTKLK